MSGELVVVRRGWSRRVAIALVWGVLLSLPLSALVCVGFLADHGPLIVAGVLASLALWRTGAAVKQRLITRRLRRQLIAQLARQVEERGLATLDAADPRRVELERTFWRAQQLDALVSLRRRFVRDPERRDLVDILLDQSASNKLSLRQLGGIAAGTALMGACFGLLFAFSLRGLASGVLMSLMMISPILMGALGLTLWEALRVQRVSHKIRQEFEQESRRITTMAELAGGLTLAEHELDAALVGALSAEEAQEGALSEVAS